MGELPNGVWVLMNNGVLHWVEVHTDGKWCLSRCGMVRVLRDTALKLIGLPTMDPEHRVGLPARYSEQRVMTAGGFTVATAFCASCCGLRALDEKKKEASCG